MQAPNPQRPAASGSHVLCCLCAYVLERDEGRLSHLVRTVHVVHEMGWARKYIAGARWQFAKTMPQWPHEYTVRSWAPERVADFERMAALTRRLGVVKPWPYDSAQPRYHHAYWEIDGWEYWIMDGPISETEVINRARV